MPLHVLLDDQLYLVQSRNVVPKYQCRRECGWKSELMLIGRNSLTQLQWTPFEWGVRIKWHLNFCHKLFHLILFISSATKWDCLKFIHTAWNYSYKVMNFLMHDIVINSWVSELIPFKIAFWKCHTSFEAKEEKKLTCAWHYQIHHLEREKEKERGNYKRCRNSPCKSCFNFSLSPMLCYAFSNTVSPS